MAAELEIKTSLQETTPARGSPCHLRLGFKLLNAISHPPSRAEAAKFSTYSYPVVGLAEAMPPRNKDPNKPKGRTSAYAFFVKTRRQKYQDEGKQVKFTDFSRECAELWKNMDEDEKTSYHEKAEEDRKRYQREMANYNPPSDDEEGGGHGRRRRRKKDPNMPKRSM